MRPDVAPFVDLEANSVFSSAEGDRQPNNHPEPTREERHDRMEDVCHRPAVAKYDTTRTVENDCGRIRGYLVFDSE